MDIEVDSVVYQKRLLLQEGEALKDHESFHSIASFDSNLYVGTSLGQLLHYHRFEDSPGFILISQQTIRNSPITRIIVMKDINRVAILCGGTISLFSLPELSPLQAGKLKDVEDILLLRSSELLVLTKTKLRVIRLNQSDIKLVKDINDISPIRAVGHKSNNLSTIANGTEYEIVDLENIRKVPLFQYSEDGSVAPNIVSFQAEDTKMEELLLTIKSDTNTSIGMFINAEGDPCRGTLSWIDKGYPDGGIVIKWPHVFGIFNDTLVISSLTDLDIKYSEETTGKLAYLPLPTSVYDDNYILKDVLKCSIPSEMIVYEEKSLYAIFPKPLTDIFKEQLVRLFNSEITEIEIPQDDSLLDDVLFSHLMFLYHIYKKEYSKLSEIFNDSFEDLLLYLYHERASDNESSKLFSGVKSVADVLKGKLDNDWSLFAIQKIRDSYLQSHKLKLQALAYSRFTNSQEFIDLCNKDKDSWKVETPNLTKIIQTLESQKLYLAVLHLYILLKNEESICFSASKFLTGEYQDEPQFDFVQLILSGLDHVKDSKAYRDLLLEVLRVDTKRGISYMKKNINGKYNKTHNDILKQVYNLVNNEDFSHLKLEVLENGLKEGDESISLEDLLDQLKEMLKNPNEMVTNNLIILYQTYLIENTYDSHKDVISWPNFLQTHKDSTECKDFIEIYLKAFELLNYKQLSIEFLGELAENPIYEFFRICCSGSIETTVRSLIDFKDYYSAELTAIYGKVPYMSDRYYTNEESRLSEDAKSNLAIIFDHYKQNKMLPAIRHFVESYGSVFTPGEIIDMLPQDIPLSYIQKYFFSLFIDLETRQRKLIIKKLFNRQDSKFTNELYTDLNN